MSTSDNSASMMQTPPDGTCIEPFKQNRAIGNQYNLMYNLGRTGL